MEQCSISGTVLGAKKLSTKLTKKKKFLLLWSVQYDAMLHASHLFLSIVTNLNFLITMIFVFFIFLYKSVTIIYKNIKNGHHSHFIFKYVFGMVDKGWP